MALAEMPDFPTPMTFEEYLVIPLEGGYDILNGVLVSPPGESWRHQDIVGNVAVAFLNFEKAHKAGHALLLPLDVIIRRVPLQTRQPDVLFFTNKRMEESGGTLSDAPLEVGPNVAVEILYERENKETISEKLQDYQKVGVEEVWLAYMGNKTVEVLQLSEAGIQTVAVYVNGQTCVSVAVPGLSLALVDIFG